MRRLIACLAVFAAHIAGATELDIPVFAGGFGTAFYEQTAREFETLRPGVTVKLYGDPRISDKLRVRMIDGDLPDATLPRDLLVPALARAGKLLDLTPFLDGLNWEGDAKWRDTFYPGALDSWSLDGGIYGLPVTYSCWTIFYNQKLFREHGWTVPRTWDEFFALCDRIKAAGGAPVSLTGIYGNYPDAFLRAAYYDLAGVEGWRQLNAIVPGARTDPRYIRAAGILQRVTQDYTIKGWEGNTHTAAQLAFLDGRAAMVVSGSWMLNEMKGKVPDDFEIGAMNFPVFPEGVASPNTIQAGADNFFLFDTGDPVKEKLAVDFLRFLTSRTRAEAFVRLYDSPPAIRGIPVDAYSPRMRPSALMLEQATEAFNMPQTILQPPAIRQALTDARLALMTGRITPAEFGARIEAAADLDRARIAAPDSVEYRHSWAGGLLLAGLGAIGAYALWRGFRVRVRPGGPPLAAGRMPGEDTQRDGRPQAAALRSGFGPGGGYLGRLRPAVGLVFVGPALLLYAALMVVPALTAFRWSLLDWDGLSPARFAGLFNFKWLLFESDVFWAALKNNAFLMVVPAVVVLPLALFLAYLLHRGIWGAKSFRAIFLFPNLLGGIAATLLWLNAYEPNGGLVNASLVALGKLLHSGWLQSFAGHPWLAARNLYTSLIPIYVWMACGFNLILFLAAMEGIDPQLYEAAEIDGAPQWRQFFAVTLPLIWEVVVIAAVFIVIAGLNAFELIWLLTSQDPDTSTHTLGTLMVSTMFKDFQIGRATAVAVMLFLLVFTGSAILMRLTRREAVE